MRYRFTRSWARILVALGFTCLALGVLLSIAAVLAPPTDMEGQLSTAQARTARIVAGALGVAVGGLVGGPMIVAGQLLLVVLDQRALLARQSRAAQMIHHRLEEWERARRGKPELTAAERLLRRP